MWLMRLGHHRWHSFHLAPSRTLALRAQAARGVNTGLPAPPRAGATFATRQVNEETFLQTRAPTPI